MPDDLALLIQDAALRVGMRTVLQGVNLSVPRGQVLALLGASGCGKTSLLRGIAGLLPLSSGQLHIEGRDVRRLPTHQRGIGMVFQHYALFPNLSVRDNIGFALEAQGWSAVRRSARADALLDLVDLRAHAEKRPGQLSGGQRQRVALARALAPHPRLLLLDEPFSALDESFRIPLRRAFKVLQRELQQSCVLVTHDRDEAFELADRVAVMFEGRIEQCDTPQALWDRPATLRVADFLGAFNRLDATRLHGAWYRREGAWIGPIECFTLTTESAPTPTDWCAHARVQAVHRARTHDELILRLESGDTLEIRVPSATALAVDQGVTVRAPVARLRHLNA